MEKIIYSRVPTRISFSGGGTDVSPFCEDYGGCVINATINKYAYAWLKESDIFKLYSHDLNSEEIFSELSDMKYNNAFDIAKAVLKHYHPKKKYEIHSFSEFPIRSGLGGSASLFLSIIGLFNHELKNKWLSPYELAELAFNLERNELKNLGGRQDQYAAAFGGINFIEFKGKDYVKVTPLKLSRNIILELEKNLILTNVGKRKQSGDVIRDQKNQMKSGANIEALKKTKEMTHEFIIALIKGDLNYFGTLMNKAWELKKKFSSLVTNPFIDQVYKDAKKAGALGGKITGAGGGGHMILYAKSDKIPYVKQSLKEKGLEVIPFSFDFNGLETWEIENEQQ